MIQEKTDSFFGTSFFGMYHNSRRGSFFISNFVWRVIMFLSQSRKTSRGGFTLIELLVVIAIIGVLVGLLLPAVQQAREAARRSACTNKLKQIGLAALNYESSNKRLPSALRTQETYAIHGQANSSGRWSFIVTLLPFMEQLPLHQTLMDKITIDSGARPWKETTVNVTMDKIRMTSNFSSCSAHPMLMDHVQVLA